MKIGDTWEVTDAVTENNTAASFGSGALEVFATPYMIAMMENAAFTLMKQDLPPEKSSVGVKLNIAHVSPSPVGMKVRATAEVTAISENGKMVEFRVKAFDEAGLIGEGTHERAVITTGRFLDKCRAKLAEG